MKNPLHFRAEGFEFGAGKETRTPDPNLGKVVLYQLSYSRLYYAHTLFNRKHIANVFLIVALETRYSDGLVKFPEGSAITILQK